MANLTEAAGWIEGLYRLETTDPVLGGEDGIDNVQAKTLGARTRYLKAQLESLGTGLVGHEAAGDPHPQYLIEAEASALIAAAVAALVNSSPATLDTLAELATALGNDANFAATMTGLLAGKAPLASPALTGVPTVPTAAGGTSSTQAASTAFVAAAITAIGLAAYAQLGLAQTWTKGQAGAINPLTDAATIALDLSLSNNYLVQLGGNRTLGMPTSVVAGQSGVITVLQDKTGSRTLAYAWPYVWANGLAGALSTPGCSEDQLVYDVKAYKQAAMAVTIATPGVVTMAGHGFYHGQRVQITTTGALPTGLTASTTYFVEVIDANSFYLCTTLANVAAGTRIATSGSQSGTHTLTGCTIRLALNKAYA